MSDTMQRIITIMQTRMGSGRLPGKVLLPLAGKPLFIRQLERIQAASLVQEVVVATSTQQEDDIIAQICKQEGFACYRGHATDLLDRHYQAGLQYKADAIVKIPSDCPLIDVSVIDKVLSYYIASAEQLDFVSNLHPASYPDGNDVEVIRFAALEKAWLLARRPMEREHTTPFIWERPELFRLGNVAMEEDYSMQYRFTIDYQEDYLFIKAVYDALYAKNPLFSVKDILLLLQAQPEIYAINEKWAGVNWYRNHLDELTTITSAQTKMLTTEYDK